MNIPVQVMQKFTDNVAVVLMYFLLLQCQSLPVVVIVHVTQQPAAEATIFWDNAFAEAVQHYFFV